MHERQAIREAVVARLIAASTVAGARVFKSRQKPLAHAELPAITVYTVQESIDEKSKSTAPRELARDLKVAIDCWVSDGADADDVLDEFALQVETAMDGDPWLDGASGDSVLASTEIGFSNEGNRPMAAAHLEFDVSYHTDMRTAAVYAALDDFDVANTKIVNVGKGDLPEADQDEDQINDIHE